MFEKFGQEVFLTITDKDGQVVLNATGLRVDFDVRNINGFSRAKVDIYNLTEKTIGDISTKPAYLTLRTSLHGVDNFTLADKFYISNILEEKILPNSITSLFCFDSIKYSFLDVPIETAVANPTLKKCMDTIVAESGCLEKVKYIDFPEKPGKQFYYDEKTKRKHAFFDGTLQSCIKQLQAAHHNFNIYTLDGGFTCLYKPGLHNFIRTDLNREKADIVLQVENMRANPKIGVANLSITSNLDGNIRPAKHIDISQLVTAGTSEDTEVLFVADNLLKDYVAGFTKYQVLTTQHKGSNYTAEWVTTVTATSPKNGNIMSSNTWFK